MSQSLIQNAVRILLYCIVLWSLIFALMNKLRIPDRFLDGMPMAGRNIIVITIILCLVSIQLIFNSHWRAALDSHWWTYRIDWYIAAFTALKLVNSMRIRTKSSKAAAAQQAAEHEERRTKREKTGPTPKRKKDEDSRRSLG